MGTSGTVATSPQYYAYVQVRPDACSVAGIFYVGKGKGARLRKTTARNPHHGNVIAKYGAGNILTGKFDCSSEELAFSLEKGLIKCLTRMGVSLTNKTEGGEGVSGLKMSDSSKQLMSLAKRGKPSTFTGKNHSAETKARLSLIASNMSEATRKKISEAGTGRTHTDETKAKMSAARKGKPTSDPAMKLGLFKGRKHSEESKTKMSEAKKGRPMHPTTKAALLRAISNPSKETIELRVSKLRGIPRPQHVIDSGRTPEALAKRTE